jgi:hypothetical protein
MATYTVAGYNVIAAKIIDTDFVTCSGAVLSAVEEAACEQD